MHNNKHLLKQTLFLLFIFYSFQVTAQSIVNNYKVRNSENAINNFTQNAIDNIDLRIATKHNPALNKTVFTTMNRNIFTRNPNCWASDLDLTCISPWNNRASYNRAGTLITPRHAILAAHYNLQIGDTIAFVTLDNLIVRKRITGTAINTQSTHKPDFAIITLESDLPATIKPCKVIPSNFADYMDISISTRVPALYLDQKENAIVADFEYIKNQYSLIVPTDQKRLDLNELGVSGDSGNPIFMILDNTLVLVGIFTFISDGPTYVCSGTSIARFAIYPSGGIQPNQNLNDLIKASDAAAGINSGYKISFFDFNTPTSIQELNFNKNYRAYCINQILHIESKSNEIFEITIYNTLGKQISQRISNSSSNSFTLPSKGIFIVSIRENLENKTFKLVAN